MSLGKKKIQHQAAAGITATDHFTPKAYAGGSAGQSVTVGFQPDLIIGKRRDSAENWWANDVTRTGSLFPNLNLAEITFQYTTPTSTGFTVNGTGGVHNTGNLITYCFKGGGSTASNSDGTIASSVSANTDAGFSVVKYTGTGANGTVGHGLGVKPNLVLYKDLDAANNWTVYSSDLTVSHYLKLNTTDSKITDAYNIFNGEPDTSVLKIGSGTSINTSGNDIIAYCFANIDSYQKIGSYSGDSSTVTVTTGFEPRFVIIKRYDSAGYDWIMYDQVRSGGTDMDDYLAPNTTAAEVTGSAIDITAIPTGFTVESGNWAGINTSGGSYLYWAIA